MEKLRALVTEFGFGTANPVSDEQRIAADRDFLTTIPLKDLLMSNADVELIAACMGDMTEKVLCAALSELLALKPQFEQEGALAAALSLMMFRLGHTVAQFDAAALELLALRATDETVRRGMPLDEIERRGEQAINRQVDHLFAKLFGMPVGVPDDGGKAEDEQIRKDLGR